MSAYKDPNKLEGKTFYDKKNNKIKIVEFDEYPFGTPGYWLEINGEEDQDFKTASTVANNVKSGTWSKTKKLMRMTEARERLASKRNVQKEFENKFSVITKDNKIAYNSKNELPSGVEYRFGKNNIFVNWEEGSYRGEFPAEASSWLDKKGIDYNVR